MGYSDGFILVLLGYFIVIIVILTLLWRIAIALDLIARHLSEISRSMEKKPTDPGKKD